MTMLKWFDTKKVDEFSDWLIAEMLKRYPPAGLDTDPKKSTKRFQKVHESLFLRVQAFAIENKLNVYTKARLGNRVKWAMREAGYPQTFADEFTHEVVAMISVIRTRSRPSADKS
jgi:hypothetical protein